VKSVAKVREIAKEIEEVAPKYLKEDYDNVGLMVGDAEKEVKKVLLALDCTKEVINEDESIETMNGPVDRQGLLYVTSSLKNIKELYSITASEKKQRQDAERNEAQINLIKAQTDKITGNNQEIEDTSDTDGDIYGN
jgi:hypothetical protein